MTADAHLRALTAEVEAIAHASEALRDRVQALRDELDALALSLRTGRDEPLAADEPPPAAATEPSASASPQTSTQGGGDLDGARLVALNMALEGEPRERTDAYLAERFQLGNRAKLLDEVYAAIED
jgi:hypothetical protein